MSRGTVKASGGGSIEPSGSPVARALWWAAGSLFLVLGAIGAVLPVLPTTPFVLLAAACYARASKRFYGYLLRSRLFGPTIERWRDTRTIPRRAKAIAICAIVLTIGTSAIFFVEPLPARIALAVVGVALVTWLARVPTEPTGADG